MIWVGVSLTGVGVRTESLQVNYYNDTGSVNFFTQLPVAVSEYVKLFVWPVGLTLYHSDLAFNAWQFGFRVIILLGFLGGTVWAFIKNKQIFFWLMWFLVSLSPTLLPLGLSWIVAERYVYMAMIGLCVVVAMGFDGLRQKVDKDTLNFVLVLVVGVLMFRTILRNNNWQTADDLWFSAERYSTLSPQNHNNLGDAYGKRGRLELSRDHFLRAIELNPRYADAMHNLGSAYLQMGEVDKAKESFLGALENNSSLWQSEQALKAIEEYEKKGP
jgi:protein O-mannosyl-transferase